MAIIKSILSKIFIQQLNWKLLLTGASIGLSSFCFYLSVKYIPVSLTIVLLMQVSWISSLGECLLFKKRISKVELLSMLVIILGTVLAGNLTDVFNQNTSVLGISLGLLSAFIYAIYVLSASKVGNKIPMFEKSALMMTGSTLILLMINFKTITTSGHFDFGLLKWGVFLAVFGTVIPPICFTIGMPKIGPGLSAILLTLELPAVVFCAHIILKEEITV